MTRQRWLLLSATALGLAVAVAAAVLFLTFRSSETKPASSAPAVPTYPGADGAQTAEEALEVARRVFTTAPPYVVHEIESVDYVETTVGAARDLLDPERATKVWDAPDELSAWLVVAQGRFVFRSVPGSSEPGPTYKYVWVVVPKETGSLGSAAVNVVPSLSSLGKVSSVPLPLPPFPTPVALNGD